MNNTFKNKVMLYGIQTDDDNELILQKHGFAIFSGADAVASMVKHLLLLNVRDSMIDVDLGIMYNFLNNNLFRLFKNDLENKLFALNNNIVEHNYQLSKIVELTGITKGSVFHLNLKILLRGGSTITITT